MGITKQERDAKCEHYLHHMTEALRHLRESKLTLLALTMPELADDLRTMEKQARVVRDDFEHAWHKRLGKGE